MLKPETIDRHKCHGKAKEEKYKDLTSLDYWWGLRELAADFDIGNYVSTSGGELTEKQQGGIAYIQLLHYTVEVKLAGAFYQMEIMDKLFKTPLEHESGLDIRVFESKEAFDSIHEDLYQAMCAVSNEMYLLLNRSNCSPIKVDQRRPVPMSPSDLRYWLKINKHPKFTVFSNILNNCDKNLDIRHHATHYGAVPVYANKENGVLYIQGDFRIGELLTKYDIGKYMKSGRTMITLLEASKPRAQELCYQINKIYKQIYLSDIFESYMESTGVRIRESYKPYWTTE